eukprot:1159096-Pelagomonas_calceolata.AAC.3
MLDDNASPAADQPDSRAVGQPLVTLVVKAQTHKGNEGLQEKKEGFVPSRIFRANMYQGKLPNEDSFQLQPSEQSQTQTKISTTQHKSTNFNVKIPMNKSVQEQRSGKTTEAVQYS